MRQVIVDALSEHDTRTNSLRVVKRGQRVQGT